MTTPPPNTPSTRSFAAGHSAQVIVFPFRERMAGKATVAQKFAAMEADARRQPVNVASGGWYHDEAISDAAADQAG